MHSALAAAVIKELDGFARTQGSRAEPWRILYAGLALANMLKDDARQFIHRKIAESVSRAIDGLDFRQIEEGLRIWTVAIDLGKPIVFTVEPLDQSPSASLASFGLATLIRAFAAELQSELIPRAELDELLVQVMSYEEMPDDLRQSLDEQMHITDILKTQPCVVTRPTDFSHLTPTYVVLGPSFLDEIKIGEKVSGSLQMLFGITLVELAFQLLRREVSDDEIRPKVVSLVRRTLS